MKLQKPVKSKLPGGVVQTPDNRDNLKAKENKNSSAQNSKIYKKVNVVPPSGELVMSTYTDEKKKTVRKKRVVKNSIM